jgi:hypothetical protein
VQDDADNGDVGEQKEGGTWVVLRDAATLLDVSIDTVKRRMQRGELPARRETIPQGFRWLVRVDPPLTEPVKSLGTNETVQQGLPAPLAPPDVVAALLNELQVRNQEIALLHGTIAALIHAAEQQTALAAGTSEPTTPKIATESPQTSEPAPTGFLAWVRRLWQGQG